MKILILGGTGFLGRHLVTYAQTRGHDLTLFNRGKRDPGLFPKIETIVGDRQISLKALEMGRWDAVIDTNAYMPRNARSVASFLKERIQHYTLTSTISVYPDLPNGVWDEETPVDPILPEEIDGTDMSGYGRRKALCEQWVAEEVGPHDKTLIIRPGLIVGPDDFTDRFTYWPVRMKEGGDVLCPGDGQDPVQFIDVRDLAEWVIHAVEQSLHGTYNAVGPAFRLTMADFVTVAKQVCNAEARLIWVPENFLEAQNVSPWSDLPAWIPRKLEYSNQKAINAGLKFRPLEETLRDTLAWAQQGNRRRPFKSGLTAEREAAVLRLWRQNRLTASH